MQKKCIDHLYLPTEVSNSRARIHTFLKHFSCSTQCTTVFLSEQLCSGVKIKSVEERKKKTRGQVTSVGQMGGVCKQRGCEEGQS